MSCAVFVVKYPHKIYHSLTKWCRVYRRVLVGVIKLISYDFITFAEIYLTITHNNM